MKFPEALKILEAVRKRPTKERVHQIEDDIIRGFDSSIGSMADNIASLRSSLKALDLDPDDSKRFRKLSDSFSKELINFSNKVHRSFKVLRK